MKKNLRPDYYDKFHCIADQCSFTCCCEWNIAVDQNTLKDWKDVQYEGKTLDSYTRKKQGTRAISLTESHHCPFLSENKLCKLVMEHGDQILSDTCTTFPRQIHEYQDRMESSLVSCCPEVIDMLNQQDRIRLIDDTEQKENVKAKSKLSSEQIRSYLMDIVQNPVVDLNMELMIVFDIMLEVLSSRGATKEEMDICSSDAHLKKIAGEIDQMEFDSLETFAENNELFLDLVENYRKEGLYQRHLESSVKLAEQYEELLSEESEETADAGNQLDHLSHTLNQFNEQFTKYDRLFRNYLASELFTNALIPDSNMESFVMMLQWITLEYVSMRHCIFLKWVLSGKEEIAYTDVRDSIVLISRITGYDQGDIEEYLDHSFQSRIWEWGYLALIVGKM